MARVPRRGGARDTAGRARPNDGRRILDAVRLLVRELRTSTVAVERATGLSCAQLFVLRALVKEPGLGVADLAERALTHQSSVSVVAAKLAGRGLITRTRHGEDGRRFVLSATAAGKRIAALGPDPVQERLLAGLGRLDAAARRRLADGLAAWTTALGLADGAPEMFFESLPHG